MCWCPCYAIRRCVLWLRCLCADTGEIHDTFAHIDFTTELGALRCILMLNGAEAFVLVWFVMCGSLANGRIPHPIHRKYCPTVTWSPVRCSTDYATDPCIALAMTLTPSVSPLLRRAHASCLPWKTSPKPRPAEVLCNGPSDAYSWIRWSGACGAGLFRGQTSPRALRSAQTASLQRSFRPR